MYVFPKRRRDWIWGFLASELSIEKYTKKWNNEFLNKELLKRVLANALKDFMI